MNVNADSKEATSIKESTSVKMSGKGNTSVNQSTVINTSIDGDTFVKNNTNVKTSTNGNTAVNTAVNENTTLSAISTGSTPVSTPEAGVIPVGTSTNTSENNEPISTVANAGTSTSASAIIAPIHTSPSVSTTATQSNTATNVSTIANTPTLIAPVSTSANTSITGNTTVNVTVNNYGNAEHTQAENNKIGSNNTNTKNTGAPGDIQRREEIRVGAKAQVDVKNVRYGGNNLALAKPFSMLVRNISTRGILLNSHLDMPKDMEFQLHLQMGRGSLNIMAIARAVRKEQMEGEEFRHSYGCTLKFGSSEDERMLRRFILGNQANERNRLNYAAFNAMLNR